MNESKIKREIQEKKKETFFFVAVEITNNDNICAYALLFVFFDFDFLLVLPVDFFLIISSG
jgi:cadmium resistance protein CadD (predicted permease)